MIGFTHVAGNGGGQRTHRLQQVVPGRGDLRGISRCHPDHHGFAQSPHDPKQYRSKDAAAGRRQHHTDQRFGTRGTQRIAPFAQIPTNGLQGILGDAHDRGKRHDPQDQRCIQGIGAAAHLQVDERVVPDQQGAERQCEVYPCGNPLPVLLTVGRGNSRSGDARHDDCAQHQKWACQDPPGSRDPGTAVRLQHGRQHHKRKEAVGNRRDGC